MLKLVIAIFLLFVGYVVHQVWIKPNLQKRRFRKYKNVHIRPGNSFLSGDVVESTVYKNEGKGDFYMLGPGKME